MVKESETVTTYSGYFDYFVEKVFCLEQPARLDVIYEGSIREFQRAQETVRRFLVAFGGKKFIEKAGAVHSSEWLAEKSRWDSWLRTQPIPTSGLRAPLILDGFTEVPLELLAQWRGAVINLKAIPKEALERPSKRTPESAIRLCELESKVQEKQAEVMAQLRAEEIENFRNAFAKFWEGERGREWGAPLPFHVLERLIKEVIFTPKEARPKEEDR